MFHKEGSTISKNGKKFKDTPLRKSDRRSLRNRVAAALLLLQEGPARNEEPTGAHAHDDDPQAPCPSDAHHLSDLLDVVFLKGDLYGRSVLLPDGNKATLYYRSPDNEPKPASTREAVEEGSAIAHWPYSRAPQCVWIDDRRSNLSLPTLPLLSTLVSSRHINRVPFLTVVVPPSVSKFLCRGADLMRAGVMRLVVPSSSSSSSRTAVPISARDGASNWSRLGAGDHPAMIVADGNPQPFAVGILNYAADFWTRPRGVAVAVVTAYGDDLWGQQRPPPNTRIPTQAAVNALGGAPYDAGDYGNVGFVGGNLVSAIVDAASAVAVSDEEEEEESSPAADHEEGDGVVVEGHDATPLDPRQQMPDEGSDRGDRSQPPAASTQGAQPTELDASSTLAVTQDELLHRAVCRALVRLRPSDFPINVASFYAQHVLSCRDDGTTIELKKTRWKKFSAYLQEQVDRALVTVAADAPKKDPLAKLTGYNKRHDDLNEILAEEKRNPKPADSNEDAAKKLVLLDLYCVPHHFVALLRLDPTAVSADHAASEDRKGSGKLTLKECRQMLDDYVARECLILPSSPNFVSLDGPLTDALFKNKKGTSVEAAPQQMSRKELADAWMNKLEAAYALVEMPGNRVIKLSRGRPPAVVIEVSRRQSNKFVTRVRGLEHYGVDPSTFAKDVATRFACAATVEVGTPSTTKAATDDVLVQGNLVDELEALLTGDERLTSHGGARDSPFRVPKNAIHVELKKGVPARKKKK